jgi:hypothetical protein
MSKIALSGNASGTGTFTIASPNSNTDRTVNLPDAGGDMVLTTATQTLTNKSIDSAQLTGNVAAARITDALNASGSAPIYACRAWVNFNNSGIRASGNVSSVTRNGTGLYTMNFATAMPDVNYSFSCHGRTPNGLGVSGVYLQDAATKSTTQFQFGIASVSGGTNTDRDTNDGTVTIFR